MSETLYFMPQPGNQYRQYDTGLASNLASDVTSKKSILKDIMPALDTKATQGAGILEKTPELDMYYQGIDAGKAAAAAGETPWYMDSKMLGSIAGLGSAFAQLAAMPSAIDMAKTQSAALKQNIATAKEEQGRRNKNISAFNSFNAG